MADAPPAGTVTVRVLLAPGAVPPLYATAGAAGADLRAAIGAPLMIPPGGRAAIPTGVSFETPEGFEIQIRPRSGLARRHGVTVLNAPGTIDADFRGEVEVLLVNLGPGPFEVAPGARVAQAVLAPVARAPLEAAEALAPTARGEGAFGSTGP